MESSMRCFQITEVDKWIPTERGYKIAGNHAQAMTCYDVFTHRITNAKFREIEYTGHYYMVTDVSNGLRMITFVFEKDEQ
jgi:hypothetical protein